LEGLPVPLQESDGLPAVHAFGKRFILGMRKITPHPKDLLCTFEAALANIYAPEMSFRQQIPNGRWCATIARIARKREPGVVPNHLFLREVGPECGVTPEVSIGRIRAEALDIQNIDKGFSQYIRYFLTRFKKS
jgi:hypothetical protein